MILHVDPHSTVPPYDQIRAQITTMAATGVLPAGARLPAIRQLAADLGLAAATVQRAYRELEHDHIVASRGRHGTFVLDPPTHIDHDEQARRLTAAAHTYAVQARHLGVEHGRALTAAHDALDHLIPAKQRPQRQEKASAAGKDQPDQPTPRTRQPTTQRRQLTDTTLADVPTNTLSFPP